MSEKTSRKKPQTKLPNNSHIREKWSEQTQTFKNISPNKKKEYVHTPRKNIKRDLIQLTPYYKYGQLLYMSREALIKICIASDVNWSDKNTDYEIRKLILDRQNRTTKTSKYIFMSLLELKQSAKELGVGASGTKQDIMNRIHRKLGLL